MILLFDWRVMALDKQTGNLGPIFAHLPPGGIQNLKLLKRKKTWT